MVFSGIFIGMKKYLFFLAFSNLIFTVCAYGFDFQGIQPLAPYGVFSTFSAESLKKGKSALALGVGKSWEPMYYRFTSQYGYGLTDAIELDVTVPYDLKVQNSVDGFEDISIAFKHRFFDEGKYGPSIAYIVFGSLPTGRDELSTEGSVGAGIIVSKKVGPVYGHANLFYTRPGSSRFNDEITFAAGIDFSAAYNFKILGELYGKKTVSGDVDMLEVRFGYRIMTAERVFTTIGAGYDVKNPQYRLFLSLTYQFPGEKKQIQRIEEPEE